MQPHNPWPSSPLLAAYIQQQRQQQQQTSLQYSSLSVPSPFSTSRPLELSTSNLHNDLTPLVNQGISSSYQYPISYPLNSQHSDTTVSESASTSDLVQLSPTDKVKGKSSGTTEPSSDKGNIQPSNVYPFMCSSHSLPSPFLYMYNRSPISPMLLVGSPCPPPSVASCPSVGSSTSGCSSMSEGSSNDAANSKKSSSNNGPRIAPSEYHVGITLPTRDVSDNEDSADSNPATPIDRSKCADSSLTEAEDSCKVAGPLIYNRLPTMSFLPPVFSNGQSCKDGVSTTSRVST